eukprot:1422813-Alexandrium_andersonii.AAC.1
MNRSGWTAEQIEARRKMEAEGLVPPYDEEDGFSDDYLPEDDYFDNDAFMAGEDGVEAPPEGADAELLASAPKRSRSNEKKAIPRRPQPSPPGHAAGAASKPPPDAEPGDPAKSTRAEPTEVVFRGQTLRVLDLGGDGDCGFRAISAAHNLTDGTKTVAQ